MQWYFDIHAHFENAENCVKMLAQTCVPNSFMLRANDTHLRFAVYVKNPDEAAEIQHSLETAIENSCIYSFTCSVGK